MAISCLEEISYLVLDVNLLQLMIDSGETVPSLIIENEQILLIVFLNYKYIKMCFVCMCVNLF